MSPQPESLTQLRTSPPTSAEGIEKYLSSGMIRGIGPVYAKKLVRSFGEKVFIKAAGRFDGNQLPRQRPQPLDQLLQAFAVAPTANRSPFGRTCTSN
jgi:hypothetical protein